MRPVRRALLSVSDKRDLASFAERLAAMGVELVPLVVRRVRSARQG